MDMFLALRKISRRSNFLLLLAVVCAIPFLGCQKKNRIYEGKYIGTERHAFIESSGLYSIDTTYHQEFDVTFYKKHYIFLKLFNNPYNSEFAIDSRNFDDGEDFPYSEGLYDSLGNYSASHVHLKFSNDSMSYIQWTYSNYEMDSLVFQGKKN